MHSRLFPTFSSIGFNVFAFTLMSLIHLDLSFVQGDRYYPPCILLHAGIQLDHHQLLKMLSFFLLYDFHFLVKNILSIGVWIYVWVLDSTPLINQSVSVTILCSYYNCSVVQLQVSNGYSSGRAIIVQECFGCPGFSVFQYEVENCSLKIYKNCIESVNYIWLDGYFTMLILPIHEHGKPFYLVISCSIFFSIT